MQMTDLEVFLPSIMPYAPGCPEPVAFAKIVWAARELCRRSRAWRGCDSFEVTDGCKVVCVPEGAELLEIETARWDEIPLEPIAFADLEREHQRWRTDDGNPKYITQANMNSVALAPAGQSGTLHLSLYLTPAEGAEQLPDFLAAHYRSTIADGALGEILMLPMQSFTDPERAVFYAQRFASKLDQLSTRNIKGQQRAPARTRPQYF